MQVIKKALDGVKWSVVISTLSTISYLLVNYFLSNLSADSKLLGQFAAVVIAFNLIMTFVFWGGSNTIIHFYNRFGESERECFLKFHFLALTMGFGLIAFFFVLFPELLTEINEYFGLILIPVSGIFILYFFISSLEMAKMNYLQGIFLDKAHHFIFLACTLVLWFVYDAYPKSTFNLFQVYILVLSLFYCLIIFLKAKSLQFLVKSIKSKSASKKIHAKYTVLTQANTVLAFLYLYLDQIIVGKKLGIEQMGVYFLLFQIAMVVKYLTLQLNKTLFSSFSKAIASGNDSELKELYFILFKYVILSCSLVSIVVAFFADPILAIFNEEYVVYTDVLYLLLLANLIGALGSLNSMLISAKGKLKSFLISNLIIGFLNIIFLLSVENDFFQNFALIKIVVAIIGQVFLFSITSRIINFDWRCFRYSLILFFSGIYIFFSDSFGLIFGIVFVLFLVYLIAGQFSKDVALVRGFKG